MTGETKPTTINILVVDDSQSCRNMMRKSLTSIATDSCTICCEEAKNGKIAVSIMKNKINSSRKSCSLIIDSSTEMYDIIFMDNEMPLMNGPSAIQAIRNIGYTGKIIGLTGNHDAVSMIEAGADIVLLKPVTLTQLKNIVMNGIREKKIKDI